MRRALTEGGDDPEQLVPTATEVLLTRFGGALGTDPQAVPQSLWDELQVEFAEKTLVDLVAFAGLMVATNLFTDAVGVALDDGLASFLPDAR